jgi:hypothetical protein
LSGLAFATSRNATLPRHQVRGYGLSFPDDFAGPYINLKSSGVIIEFKNQVERHRTAFIEPSPGVVVSWHCTFLDDSTLQSRIEHLVDSA